MLAQDVGEAVARQLVADGDVIPSEQDGMVGVSAQRLLGADLGTVTVRQVFSEDGTYALHTGSGTFRGEWDMPDQRGERRAVVVHFDQEGVRQRIIMWVRFLNDQQMEVADENGVTKVFQRR